MNKRILRSALMGLGIAVLFAGLGYTGDVYTVDETIPMPDGQITKLGFEAGPIVFEELVIRNPPNEGDISKAQFDPDDKSHPKLQLGMSNKGPFKMEVQAIIRFEDDEGNVFMSCDRKDTVDPGALNDHTNFCMVFDSIKTIDWPKVTTIRITASIKPD
jgi:hypothetical protein